MTGATKRRRAGGPVMPGIVGLMGNVVQARFDLGTWKLMLFPSYAARKVQVAPDAILASVTRHAVADGDAAFAEDGEVSVLVYGSVFSDQPAPRRVAASEILADYRAARFERSVGTFDGGFVAVVHDRRKRLLTIANDRLGSQPVYFAERNGTFAFGPEVKAVLTLAGIAPRYSPAGVSRFLVAGHDLADGTLFEDVHCLEPATILVRDLARRTTTRRRYWELAFDPDPALEKRAAAEEALLDGLLRAHRLLTLDGAEDCQVFLSGGLDSRGILATLAHIGVTPVQALGWGLRKDIPFSDAYIAERLARAYGVPFRFLAYDTGDFVANASDWAFQTELANDNVGWYGEGVGALRSFYSASTRVSFVGDEVWGFGGYARDEEEARRLVHLPSRVPPPLARILRPGVAAEIQGLYDESIARILRRCGSADFTDRKDFLYLSGRAARFIVSLGYYKEYATELRRPYLARGVVEVVRRLSRFHRSFKNLYCSTLARFFPEAMAYPDQLVSSLPDWSYDLRCQPHLRAFLSGLLRWEEIERGPLEGLIARLPFEAMRDRFFAEPVAPLDRRVRWGLYLRRRVVDGSRLLQGAVPRLKLLLGRGRRADATDDFDVLRRIALCVLLQRRLGDLGFADAAAGRRIPWGNDREVAV